MIIEVFLSLALLALVFLFIHLINVRIDSTTRWSIRWSAIGLSAITLHQFLSVGQHLVTTFFTP